MASAAPERGYLTPPAAPHGSDSGAAPELVWALATIVVVSVPYALLARGGLPGASGLVGHALGVAGLLLLLFAEVGYSWRKRTSRSGPGSVQRWLQAHVYAGLVGPYLALLHSAFRFRGLAGVLTLLMGVVVLSGVVGRFAYTRAPRSRRRGLALWYLLHVPLALALLALAAVHAAAALYYATLLH